MQVLCEGDTWVAFFPTDPATPGHTLVIPREHIPDLWSLDGDMAAQLMGAVIQVGQTINTAVTPPGMNLISSSGPVAEQTVFHVHLHVVPRYPGDDIDAIWPPKKRMDDDLKQSVAKKISDACKTD